MGGGGFSLVFFGLFLALVEVGLAMLGLGSYSGSVSDSLSDSDSDSGSGMGLGLRTSLGSGLEVGLGFMGSGLGSYLWVSSIMKCLVMKSVCFPCLCSPLCRELHSLAVSGMLALCLESPNQTLNYLDLPRGGIGCGV